MDFLKNEIASKKRQLDQVTASLSPSPDAPPPPKYLKRAELERIEQEQREQERKRKEQERREKLYGTKANTTKKSGARSSTDAATDGATTTTNTTDQEASTRNADAGGPGPTPGETFFVSNEEAVRRLRQKGQPIRLFAESDKDRRLRLRALELIEDSSSNTAVGQRNEFAKAMEGQELGLELDKVAKRAAGGGGDVKGKGKGKGSAVVGTPDPDPAAGLAEDKGKGKGESADEADREPNPKDQDVLVDLDLVRTNPHKVYPQIYHAFKVRGGWVLSLSLSLLGSFLCATLSSFVLILSYGSRARLC
mgnify:CR=1 FL=1|jgi:pre-mRNA-splicing factor 18